MTGYLKEIWTASVNLLKGMRVTLVTMVKPAVTVQYPDEKLLPFEGFRGALRFEAETCIACSLCAKACPSECISMESQKSPEGKRVPKVDWYAVDLGKCNFCRLCEEACPTKPKSVHHSLDYEVVFDDRSQMTRYWKKGFPALGRSFDPAKKEFMEPKGHLRVEGGDA